jgi:cytochrome b561
MRITNTQRNWGALAKLFHWVAAVLVLGNLGLGYWAAGLATEASLRGDAFYWHKTIGLTLLWLVALRLVWRGVNPTPGLPATMPGWQRALARLTHLALYMLLIAMPVSGWLIHATSEAPTLVLYGVFTVPQNLPWALDESQVHALAKSAHYWCFITLAAVVVIHVFGAFKHHVVDNDPVLRRMLPFTRATDPIRGE